MAFVCVVLVILICGFALMTFPMWGVCLVAIALYSIFWGD